MIEPQNTMMPVAEPRPVDTPQGEGEGFGAMLAQSLGMAPQVNPDVVQQINTNPQPKGQQNPAGEQPGDEPPAPPAIQGVAGNPLPVRAATHAAPGVGSAREAEAQQQVAGPGGSGFVPSRPVRAQRFVRTDQGVAPLPTLPTPPSAEPAPHVVRPLDTIWKPSPQGDAGIPAPPVIPDDGEMTLQPGDPGDSIWKPRLDSEPVPTATPAPPTDENAAPRPSAPPAPAAAPGIDPPDPAGNPVAGQPPVDEAVPPELNLEPTPGKPVNVDVTRGRTIPEPPTLDSNAAPTESAGSKPAAAVPAATPPAAPPRVELAPDRPVRLDTVPVPTVTDRAAAVAEPAVAAMDPVSTDSGPGLGTVQAAASTPVTPGSATLDGMQPQASALAERVMQAIDLQRTQPPPRSMVVDIPELEGLRLVVSVRSAGHVSVTPAGSTANPDVFAPFATDLSRVLAERGFVMNGDSRRQGYNPHNEDEAPPAPRRSSRFRRPAPIDNDLRI